MSDDADADDGADDEDYDLDVYGGFMRLIKYRMLLNPLTGCLHRNAVRLIAAAPDIYSLRDGWAAPVGRTAFARTALLGLAEVVRAEMPGLAGGALAAAVGRLLINFPLPAELDVFEPEPTLRVGALLSGAAFAVPARMVVAEANLVRRHFRRLCADRAALRSLGHGRPDAELVNAMGTLAAELSVADGQRLSLALLDTVESKLAPFSNWLGLASTRGALPLFLPRRHPRAATLRDCSASPRPYYASVPSFRLGGFYASAVAPHQLGRAARGRPLAGVRTPRRGRSRRLPD